MSLKARVYSALGLLFVPFVANAGYVLATNNGNWDVAATWSNGVPLAGDVVVIPSGRTVTNNVQTVLLSSLTNSGTLVCVGTNNFLTATNITVLGTVTHPVNTDTNGADNWTPDNGVLIICTNLTVSGSITVNGKGYSGGGWANGGDGRPGRGPGGGGCGSWGGGGGHGGAGGAVGAGGTSGPTYGSSNAPVLPGSGGGRNNVADPTPGWGGGMIRIVTDSLTVNGAMSANGQDGAYQSGGGSGGSIYITCRSFAGNESVSANGGGGGSNGGGGGGGRIAVVYSGSDSFVGQVTIAGGTMIQETGNGSSGTVYRCYNGSDPVLTVTGNPSGRGTPSPYPYGNNAVAAGTQVTNTVPSPADETNDVRYASVGWQVTTNGILMSGNSSTQAVFTMPDTNATLTFFWTNEYRLIISTGLHGTASVGASGWYTNGVQVQISATADVNYVFSLWTGDVPTADRRSNPLTVTMDQARSIVAQFGSATGETKIWTGNGSWTNAANWASPGMPGPFDTVILASGNVMLNVPAFIGDLTVSNGVTLTVTNGWSSILTAKDVTVRGTVTHPANTDTNISDGWASDSCVQLVCSNLTVTATGTFNADGKGYAGGPTDTLAGYGPGRGRYDGSYGGGGAYGGFGGEVGWGGSPYGSAQSPNEPGSGGGRRGGAGGGLIRIEATNSDVVIDGIISANASAANYQAGGGAGGGVYLACRTFRGSGLLSACGTDAGANGSGGGSGGRISVVYNASLQSNVTPRPTAQFLVGRGWGLTGYGQVGTLYFPDNGLLYAPRFNGGQIISFSSWSADALSISNSSLYLPAGFRLVVTNSLALTNSQLYGTNLSLSVGGHVMLVSTSAAYLYSGPGGTSTATIGGSVLITNASRLYVYGGATNAGDLYGTLVAVNGDMTIYDGCWACPVSHATNGGSVKFMVNNLTMFTTNSGFDATLFGYTSKLTNGFGPGAGKTGNPGNYRGGGGGYGGWGGTGSVASASGGSTYGSVTQPTDPGSAGGGSENGLGGVGGGLIWIEAQRTMTLDGSLFAKAGVPLGFGGGGGSGGGIYLACKTLRGSNAVFRADGASSGGPGGGGGGGRIAIWRTRHEANTNAWGISVTNGTSSGGSSGQLGTVFWGWSFEEGTIFVIH